MSKVKMSDVLLDRKWSGHEAGEVVTVEDYTAKSMVKKNYGRIITAGQKKKIEKASNQQIETADAPPQAENSLDVGIEQAVAPPQNKDDAGSKGSKGDK